MPGGYSRSVRFDATGAVAACVELPAPPRGILNRLIITQISGVAVGSAATIFDRRGACAAGVDRNVAQSGAVTSVLDLGGFASVTFTADHDLLVGDTFVIKGSTVSAYNVTHTVTAITSSTVVVTSIAYTSNATGGVWQTPPLDPTVSPNSHIVYEATVISGTPFKAFGLQVSYENRDNQSVTMRSRHSALYLELTPSGTGAKVFEVAITSEMDVIA